MIRCIWVQNMVNLYKTHAMVCVMSIIYHGYDERHLIPAVGMPLGGCFSPYWEWKMPSVLLTGSNDAGWSDMNNLVYKDTCTLVHSSMQPDISQHKTRTF